MPRYRLSRKADVDLQEIYLYSYEHFGPSQAESYFQALSVCFQLLAERPRIGQVRPGKQETFRVFIHKSHVIAYRLVDEDILIQRVLDVRRDWRRMLPGR